MAVRHRAHLFRHRAERNVGQRSARRVDANLRDAQGMPGAGLTGATWGKALPARPTFQPYWGTPAVGNDRGGGGNVGIMRSPLPRHHLTRPVEGGREKRRGKGRMAKSLATPALFSEVAEGVTGNGYGDGVSLFREPDAANPHVRFDERGVETEAGRSE